LIKIGGFRVLAELSQKTPRGRGGRQRVCQRRSRKEQKKRGGGQTAVRVYDDGRSFFRTIHKEKRLWCCSTWAKVKSRGKVRATRDGDENSSEGQVLGQTVLTGVLTEDVANIEWCVPLISSVVTCLVARRGVSGRKGGSGWGGDTVPDLSSRPGDRTEARIVPVCEEGQEGKLDKTLVKSQRIGHLQSAGNSKEGSKVFSCKYYDDRKGEGAWGK